MANYRGENLIENTVDIWNGTRKTAEEIVEFISAKRGLIPFPLG